MDNVCGPLVPSQNLKIGIHHGIQHLYILLMVVLIVQNTDKVLYLLDVKLLSGDFLLFF